MFSKLKQKTQEEKSLASATAKKARELQKGDASTSEVSVAIAGGHSEVVHQSDSVSGESGQTEVPSPAAVPEPMSSSEAVVTSHDVKSAESVAVVTDTHIPVSTQEETTSSGYQPVSVAEDINPSQQKGQTPLSQTPLPPNTPSETPTSNPHTTPRSPAPSTPVHHKVCTVEPLMLYTREKCPN